MSGICDTCQWNQFCRRPMGEVDSCWQYECQERVIEEHAKRIRYYECLLADYRKRMAELGLEVEQ